MRSPRSLADSVSAFLSWLALRVKPVTVDWYRPYLSKFVTDLGAVPLQKVTRLDIESHSAKPHPLIAISRFFRWCRIHARWIKRDPSRGVKVPKIGRRTRTLERRERVLMRWLARADRRRRPLALAMLTLEMTACRPGEMRALTWDALRGPGGLRNPPSVFLRSGICYFELTEFKGKDRRNEDSGPRIITIPPRLGRSIERIRRSVTVSVTGPVFTSSSGEAWTKNGFRCAWRRFRLRLSAAGRVSVKGLVPYLYRHSKATELARDGFNSRLIADYLGHAGLDMVSVYVHSQTLDLVKMANGLKP